jgi:hypothetical protein
MVPGVCAILDSVGRLSPAGVGAAGRSCRSSFIDSCPRASGFEPAAAVQVGLGLCIRLLFWMLLLLLLSVY